MESKEWGDKLREKIALMVQEWPVQSRCRDLLTSLWEFQAVLHKFCVVAIIDVVWRRLKKSPKLQKQTKNLMRASKCMTEPASLGVPSQSLLILRFFPSNIRKQHTFYTYSIRKEKKENWSPSVVQELRAPPTLRSAVRSLGAGEAAAALDGVATSFGAADARRCFGGRWGTPKIDASDTPPGQSWDSQKTLIFLWSLQEETHVSTRIFDKNCRFHCHSFDRPEATGSLAQVVCGAPPWPMMPSKGSCVSSLGRGKKKKKEHQREVNIERTKNRKPSSWLQKEEKPLGQRVTFSPHNPPPPKERPPCCLRFSCPVTWT